MTVASVFLNWWLDCAFRNFRPLLYSSLFFASRTRYNRRRRLDVVTVFAIAFAKYLLAFGAMIKCYCVIFVLALLTTDPLSLLQISLCIYSQFGMLRPAVCHPHWVLANVYSPAATSNITTSTWITKCFLSAIRFYCVRMAMLAKTIPLALVCALVNIYM